VSTTWTVFKSHLLAYLAASQQLPVEINTRRKLQNLTLALVPFL